MAVRTRNRKPGAPVQKAPPVVNEYLVSVYDLGAFKFTSIMSVMARNTTEAIKLVADEFMGNGISWGFTAELVEM